MISLPLSTSQESRVSSRHRTFGVSALVTEKSTALGAMNQYCLKAPYEVTKPQLATFLQQVFHVHPTAIRMIPMVGRHVRYGATKGVTKRWKKFMVTLPKEEKLVIRHEQVHAV